MRKENKIERQRVSQEALRESALRRENDQLCHILLTIQVS